MESQMPIKPEGCFKCSIEREDLDWKWSVQIPSHTETTIKFSELRNYLVDNNICLVEFFDSQKFKLHLFNEDDFEIFGFENDEYLIEENYTLKVTPLNAVNLPEEVDLTSEVDEEEDNEIFDEENDTDVVEVVQLDDDEAYRADVYANLVNFLEDFEGFGTEDLINNDSGNGNFTNDIITNGDISNGDISNGDISNGIHNGIDSGIDIDNNNNGIHNGIHNGIVNHSGHSSSSDTAHSSLSSDSDSSNSSDGDEVDNGRGVKDFFTKKYLGEVSVTKDDLIKALTQEQFDKIEIRPWRCNYNRGNDKKCKKVRKDFKDGSAVCRECIYYPRDDPLESIPTPLIYDSANKRSLYCFYSRQRNYQQVWAALSPDVSHMLDKKRKSMNSPKKKKKRSSD